MKRQIEDFMVDSGYVIVIVIIIIMLTVMISLGAYKDNISTETSNALASRVVSIEDARNDVTLLNAGQVPSVLLIYEDPYVRCYATYVDDMLEQLKQVDCFVNSNH